MRLNKILDDMQPLIKIGKHVLIITIITLLMIFFFFYIYLPVTTNHGETVTVPDLKGIALEDLDNFLLKGIKTQIKKILENQNVGKPLKYSRGERSLYIKPFRLIYSVMGNELILLKFEHRKKVYKK